MKNFLELLATEPPRIKLRLHLVPVIDGQYPQCRVIINQTTKFQNVLREEVWLEHDIALLESLDVNIMLHDKVYEINQECAVVIQALEIDSHKMLPGYAHHAVYINDHNYSEPTTYLGFNGSWQWALNQPFYRWWHHAQGRGWLLEPNATAS